ncbi:methyl-accepting chemotaxis protein [Natronolimnobius baerhuensis]|uniref:Chemotaxis protein n=1 Tax=Natronolimnobius baerhuensis TaxID=253108 RepID=A0A202ECJ8_9EURY|nr:HAMP domain-containing methyl-accepting chemotaxis protein [Natronolimnobius baerhuensis]OVE85996.1 chemotaxis protein [Natronolimnobius baerhuensis]
MSTSTTDHLGPNGERPSSIRGRYQSLLWASMDRLGIADSLERKMMAAVVLQFCSTLAVFALPIVFLGPTEAFAVFPTAQIALTGVVFVLAVAAFVNTLVITREDVISPLERLRADADRIASGDLEERPADPTQADEIGELQASFTDMHDSLTTVAAQADALAREEFDASVLAQRVPGEFGDSLERMQTGLESRIDDLEESRERIERQRERVEQRNAALEADAERIRAVLQQCAEGDFTRRVSLESDHDAMADIATGLNATLDDLEATISEIQSLADEVDNVGTEVSTSITEIERASEAVSESADEISSATDEQNDRFEGVLDEMSALSATIEEIASTADGVAEVSDHAADSARDGRQTADEALDALERLEDRSTEIVDRIEQLDEELAEVSNIADLIDGIAEETNLLAVNASIEAARAGGDGSRFAVVADEIRSLAEETSDATTEVDAIVTDVQESARASAAEVQSMQEELLDGTETIAESLSVLTTVADRVQEANEGVQSINDATDEQATTSQQVVAMVDDATDQSEQTLQETTSVAAAAEEQTATIGELSDAAGSLSQTATELNSQVAAFTVEQS